MKRFIMAIVCLMTMVLSVNAQYRIIGDEPKSSVYHIDEDIYCKFKNMNKGKFVLLICGGDTHDNYTYGAWFYEIENNEIENFVTFLKKVEIKLKQYENIALSNDVYDFEKELDLSYMINVIYLENFHYQNIFILEKESVPCKLKSIFHVSRYKSGIEITPKRFVSYLEKKDKYNKINCTNRFFSLHGLGVLIKQLENIEEKVLLKNSEIIKIKKEKQERREAKLREKKKIEDLFN